MARASIILLHLFAATCFITSAIMGNYDLALTLFWVFLGVSQTALAAVAAVEKRN